MIHELFYKKKDRHFRDHRTDKGVHPAYVVGEGFGTYKYFGITHSPKKGKHHRNHKLVVNPKVGSQEASYLRKKLEEDRKASFERMKKKGYRMSKADDDYVDQLIAKKK